MVRRQEEKRRKWFTNRAWSCRSLIWGAVALPLLQGGAVAPCPRVKGPCLVLVTEWQP
jgi:hypothetical protein